MNTLSFLRKLDESGLLVSAAEGLPETLGALKTDNRLVKPGDGFLAYRGVSFDSHTVVESAIASGAGFIICEALPLRAANLPFIQVKCSRRAWSVFYSLFYGQPESKLKFIGITGTNGKTSTAYLTHQILKQRGIKSAFLGTLGAFYGDAHEETSMTTPDPPRFYQLLSTFLEAGVEWVIMEVSSHALSFGRVFPIKYDAIGFTSFSQDHLDFHGSFEHYWESKCLIFRENLKDTSLLVINSALPKLPPIPKRLRKNTWIYGSHPTSQWTLKLEGDFHQATISMKLKHLSSPHIHCQIDRETFDGEISFFTNFAAENFLAALILGREVTGGYLDSTKWSQLKLPPGRLEPVSGVTNNQPLTFIDYAHTPDALEKVLLAIRELHPHHIHCVFGCGGDRDKEKRPLMGEVAYRLADHIYVTNDNPRNENPTDIIEDILRPIKDLAKVVVEPDRRKAIEFAINAASGSDIVLIAGKGHENYQEYKGTRSPFSDFEVAKLFLEAQSSER